MTLVSRSLLFGFSAAAISSAAIINYNPAATTDTGWNTCDNIPGQKCRTTAYFDGQSLNDQNDSENINALFNTAFTTWNASGGGQGWTLNFGGDLDGTFEVTIAKAMQFEADNTPSTDGTVRKGGLEISIDVSGITLPTLGANQYLVWSQGLFDNYLGNGTLTTPFYEMDGMPTGTGGCTATASPWCLPAYPYTYADNKFYDRPGATYQPPGPQAFFTPMPTSP